MSEIALSKGAREIAEALQAVAREYGAAVSFVHRGKHPYAQFERDGQSRKIWFASSPSDFRAVNNSVREARRIFRELGWEKPMTTMVSTGKGSMFDAQPASTGAAGPVVHIKPGSTAPRGELGEKLAAAISATGRPSLRGVPLPDIPDIARQPYNRETHRYDPDYQAFVASRNAFIEAAIAGGATARECAEVLTAAGHAVPVQTIHATRHAMRQRAAGRGGKAAAKKALPPPCRRRGHSRPHGATRSHRFEDRRAPRGRAPIAGRRTESEGGQMGRAERLGGG